MSNTKQARVEAAPWLLPPIVLQVVHYLDKASDVITFLDAAPNAARDKAFDALVTLLVAEPDLWPATGMDDLYKTSDTDDDSIVTTALPALRKVLIAQGSEIGNGLWAPNVVSLTIVINEEPLDCSVLQEELAASELTSLKSVHVDWNEEVDDEQLDDAVAAITASCPNLCELDLATDVDSELETCESLLGWLARSGARQFKLGAIDFAPGAATDVAHALLSSTTLHTIQIFGAPNVLESFLESSCTAPPQQLRNLTIGHGSSWLDVTVPTTVRTLELVYVKMKTFSSPLPEVQSLRLCHVTLTSDAVSSLAAVLAATTTLFRLDLGDTTLSDDQLQAILDALPHWLNRQHHKCYLRLHAKHRSEPRIAAVLTQIRNTLEVQIELCGGDDFDFATCHNLLPGFGTTSRMQLRFSKTG
ncbi:hypothetical protein SDRG_08203 [Saprolegnia diclina VS20]|uniref:F-box domain-containing protein n=1 Tax=Saprolegnia diclina (strain VS20) TaxID=1156394 RepID=T0RPJ8_SAPDV|nr:hypothetical protein SDRG_08203 [Saprolegnia diclina VS20]EQC34433.1 hypothetical protein SDRG_08203 [Saprolegnia diclina VS20]|eukprot:XP_008612295.1 hypothetical protein SDRG_08203 [Saprolegnia diclina VS20]